MNDNATGRTENEKRTGRGSRQFHSELPPFVPLPKALLLDPEITPVAKIVWAFVVEASWRDNGDAWDAAGVTNEQFAAALGITAPTVRKAVKELTERLWLSSWKRGQGLANGYQANAKPHAQDERNFQGGVKESSAPRAHASKEVDLEQPLEGSTANAVEPAATRRKPRKRDLVFDALAEATGSDPQLESGRIAKAANALRKLPAYIDRKEAVGRDAAEAELADLVRERAVRYRRVFDPDIALTPQALVNNWRRVRDMPERPLTPEEIAAGAYR